MMKKSKKMTTLHSILCASPYKLRSDASPKLLFHVKVKVFFLNHRK